MWPFISFLNKMSRVWRQLTPDFGGWWHLSSLCTSLFISPQKLFVGHHRITFHTHETWFAHFMFHELESLFPSYRVGKMAPGVKRLLHKHKDLSQILSTSVKASLAACVSNPNTEKGEPGISWEPTHWEVWLKQQDLVSNNERHPHINR